MLAYAPVSNRRLTPFTSCRNGTHHRTQCLQNGASRALKSASALPMDQQLHGVSTGADKPALACQVSRRAAVIAMVAAAVALIPRSAARADEEPKLPKEYRQLVKRLSEELSDSIEAEANGASEAEVRRKADPAKDTVREFVRKWRDNPRVSSDLSHAQIKEALAELGEFYLAYGQRTKLTPPVKESVLRHLAAAKQALPVEPEKKQQLGSGLMNLF